MSSLTLTTEYWPILVTRLRDGATDADYARYFRDFPQAAFSSGERFASLVDASTLTEPPSAAQRKAIADWQKTEVTRGVVYNVGIAMVLTSRVVRGALTALHWLFPPPVQTVSVATFDEGYSWCVDALERDGVVLPSLVRDARFDVRANYGG